MDVDAGALGCVDRDASTHVGDVELPAITSEVSNDACLLQDDEALANVAQTPLEALARRGRFERTRPELVHMVKQVDDGVHQSPLWAQYRSARRGRQVEVPPRSLDRRFLESAFTAR